MGVVPVAYTQSKFEVIGRGNLPDQIKPLMVLGPPRCDKITADSLKANVTQLSATLLDNMLSMSR